MVNAAVGCVTALLATDCRGGCCRDYTKRMGEWRMNATAAIGASPAHRLGGTGRRAREAFQIGIQRDYDAEFDYSWVVPERANTPPDAHCARSNALLHICRRMNAGNKRHLFFAPRRLGWALRSQRKVHHMVTLCRTGWRSQAEVVSMGVWAICTFERVIYSCRKKKKKTPYPLNSRISVNCPYPKHVQGRIRWATLSFLLATRIRAKGWVQSMGSNETVSRLSPDYWSELS